MSRMWHHPENEQRPAVLEWLQKTVPPGRDVVDIGAGEAYYIDALRSARYAFVEPIQTLRRRAGDRAGLAGIRAPSFTSVAALQRSRVWERCNCTILIHSLLYLTDQELESVAELANRTLTVFVYPDPCAAVTFQFEDSVNIDQSRRLVALKDRLLGPPSSRVEVDTHFRLPATTTDSEIAFLVSHTVLRRPLQPVVAKGAMQHVRLNRASWHHGDAGWKLPQPQIMEVWRR
jgi:hypothetical protein